MNDQPIKLSPTAFNRIEEIREKKGNAALHLRLTVSGGGCSGFKYDLQFDHTIAPDDIVIDDAAVIDPVSAPYVMGATIDYVVTMMGENFKVINPNATSGCGCGESFAV